MSPPPPHPPFRRRSADVFIPCSAANVSDLKGNYAHLNVPINDIIHAQVLH